MKVIITGILVSGLTLISSTALAWSDDPSYGTSDPPNYKRKKQSSSESRYVYPSYFTDPYYGTGNPPGYDARRAQEMGRIYVPTPKAPRWSDPTYGTSDPNPRRTIFRSRTIRR